MAVLETANPVLDWMESFPGRESTSETVARGRSQRVVPLAIPEKPHCVPFLHDREAGGRAAQGRNLGEVEVAASSGAAVVGPHLE